MFSNCIERVGHKTTTTTTTTTTTKKNQWKNKQTKNGGMDRKEILNSEPDKFLIPVNQIYLYATLPPRGLYRI